MGSINKSHNEVDGGILLFSGELILLYCDSVNCEVGGKENVKGRIYLTTHRIIMIVTPYKQNSAVKSLSAPFCAIKKINLEQPIFGANYIEATVSDEADASKTFSFKLKFSKGGAVEFAMTMNRAVAAVARLGAASQAYQTPAYAPSPTDSFYQAPPTVYAPGYNCGIQLPTQQFPDQPPIGFIYTSSAPPPYPGLSSGQGGPTGAASGPSTGGYPSDNKSGVSTQTNFSGAPQSSAYPSPAVGFNGPTQPGVVGNAPSAGYPGSAPAAPLAAYPTSAPSGFPSTTAGGYPDVAAVGYPQPGPPPPYTAPADQGQAGNNQALPGQGAPSAPAWNS